MENTDGFTPILAVFYAVFHPTEGTKIIHQVPEGSIFSVKGDTDNSNSLFDFDTVKNYIIPKPQLCNKLITFKIDKFRVMGFPVNIQNSDYSRNSFNFNFCFVFPYDSDTTPYESAIRRMGKMFRVLEEQSFLLSKLDKDYSFFKSKDTMTPPIQHNNFNFNDNNEMINTPGHSKTKKITLSSIESLVHQIYQDLNNYSECCIPLDSANSVDIKLFPILPPPLNIKAFQVPVAKVKLNQLVDSNWDPTMLKILPYIDGINSIKRISELADADYLLTKQCIQHLMHYKCIEIMEIFQFGNIYAPTNHIDSFLKVNGMAEECQAYIVTGENRNTLSDLPLANKESFSNSPNSSTFNNSVSPLSKASYLSMSKIKTVNEHNSIHLPSKTTLFYLYRSMNQSQTIKEWYIRHRKSLTNIDIRRFVNFGVRRGLIYRIYSYPVLNSVTRSIESNHNSELDDIIKEIKQKSALKSSSDTAITPAAPKKSLLKNMVNESNLQTGKSKRRVSFNYNVNSRSSRLKDLYSDDDEDNNDDSDNSDYFTDRSDSVTHGDDYKDYDSSDAGDEDDSEEVIKLVKLLRGFQHFDSINIELQKSRAEVEKAIEKLGSFNVINA